MLSEVESDIVEDDDTALEAGRQSAKELRILQPIKRRSALVKPSNATADSISRHDPAEFKKLRAVASRNRSHTRLDFKSRFGDGFEDHELVLSGRVARPARGRRRRGHHLLKQPLVYPKLELVESGIFDIPLYAAPSSKNPGCAKQIASGGVAESTPTPYEEHPHSARAIEVNSGTAIGHGVSTADRGAGAYDKRDVTVFRRSPGDGDLPAACRQARIADKEATQAPKPSFAEVSSIGKFPKNQDSFYKDARSNQVVKAPALQSRGHYLRYPTSI